MVSALAKIEIFSFWPKTLDYSKAELGQLLKMFLISGVRLERLHCTHVTAYLPYELRGPICESVSS